MKYKHVLVIGDTHCPAMAEGYVQFLYNVYKHYDCKQVIHIGDLVDLHSISYHENDPDCLSPAQEIEAAKQQINMLIECFPRVSLLTGNHDALVQRKAVTAGLSQMMLKAYADLFCLPKKWVVYPRYYKLRIDDVLYQHGDGGKGGVCAALKNAQAEFTSVVQGHFHSQACVSYHANESKLVFGMQVGCGIDWQHLQMSYGQRFSQKPVLSCGVVINSTEAYVQRMQR